MQLTAHVIVRTRSRPGALVAAGKLIVAQHEQIVRALDNGRVTSEKAFVDPMSEASAD